MCNDKSSEFAASAGHVNRRCHIRVQTIRSTARNSGTDTLRQWSSVRGSGKNDSSGLEIHPPPLSPWHGGFYERLVAFVKAPLRRVLRKSLLALDELSTILLEIEHVVNDRPITYVAGVDEPPPLTPNMLAGSQIGRVDIQEESISHRGANSEFGAAERRTNEEVGTRVQNGTAVSSPSQKLLIRR